MEPLPVGRVLGSEDATPMVFRVGVAPEQWLQLDDVVVTDRTMPGGEVVRLSGLVTEIRAVHEGARFGSDVFLIADGLLPAQTFEAAEVMTTRIEPETYVPPLPGTPVRRATGAERDTALYFDRMAAKLPIGLGRDGAPLFANLEFLDGTRGAHVNISGISGVATKTSYATFLLYSLFRSGVLGAEAANTKALVFNVKGEDLLFLDQPNTRLTDVDRQRYQRLGLPAEPFASVNVYAPPRRQDPNAGPDVSSRRGGVNAFYWTLEEFCAEQLLPFVFADSEDERQQYTMVVHHVTAKLARDGKSAGDDGQWAIDGTTLRTYEDLVDLVVDRVTDEDTTLEWAGRAVGMGTINAFVRRLLSSRARLAPLVRADIARRPAHRISTSDAQVTVVDLHNLHDRAQRFVVGVTLQKAFEDKEQRGSPGPLTFVVLDELNKYAPREGSSPIKEILLDVAERGRSLGMILVGAQQTASEVERRVIANSALRVAGRLDAAEAARPEYGFLPEAHRRRATIAKPGTMFVSQPEIPVPLVTEFPFPAWATRPSETTSALGHVGPATDDEFDGLQPMRLLHTADWHLGKVLKGVDRLPEQRAVAAEIVAVAASEEVDLVVVAGDIFESGAPPPEAQRLAFETLLALRATGADVVVIAGNHDNADAFEAVRPVFAAAGVHVLGRACPPDAGGVLALPRLAPVSRCGWPCCRSRRSAASCGLPTCSGPRPPTPTTATPNGWRGWWPASPPGSVPTPSTCSSPTAPSRAPASAVVSARRRASSTTTCRPRSSPPAPHMSPSATSIAHRRYRWCPAWYAGSPIAVDFGEETAWPSVLVLDASPGAPARVRRVELTSPRRLRTVTGTVAELSDAAADVGDALLRVVVTEPARAGLGDEVRALLPNAIDVQVAAPTAPSGERRPTRAGRSTTELFHQYLAERQIDDPAVETLFAELLDAASASGGD